MVKEAEAQERRGRRLHDYDRKHHKEAMEKHQVWPPTHFFQFPFCKISLFCLEGKSMTPLQGNTFFFFIPSNNSLVFVSDP